MTASPRRILVLGGTAWLGRAIAAAALRAGHDVTCLARGASGAVPDGARLVRADRDAPEALGGVSAQAWDAVVDLARQPGHVRRAAAALRDAARTYVFVSSVSAYADHSAPGQDEAAPLLEPLAADLMPDISAYGAAKVACEQAVLTSFGRGRSLLVRPGLIGGPEDPSGRPGYWPLRLARPSNPDGLVLVPDVPTMPVQVIDVRDLATWIVDAAARGLTGTFNATGDSLTFADYLAVAGDVGGRRGVPVPAPQEWLLAHGVAPWRGPRSLPVWLPMPENAGFGARVDAAARAAGLTPRPLRETLADTLAWELPIGPGAPGRAGLTDDDERALLRDLP